MRFPDNICRDKETTDPRQRVIEHPERDYWILVAPIHRQLAGKHVERNHHTHLKNLFRYRNVCHSHTQRSASLLHFFLRDGSNCERANYRDKYVASDLAERDIVAFFHTESRAHIFGQRDDVGTAPLPNTVCCE